MVYMKCPFCDKQVENEQESVSGCKGCVNDWINNMDVDHFPD